MLLTLIFVSLKLYKIFYKTIIVEFKVYNICNLIYIVLRLVFMANLSQLFQFSMKMCSKMELSEIY